jgi:ADP-L-glycero-D-manno-heptose 6-epimerase
MIVITGANGFIGANLLGQVHGQAGDVVAVDDYPSIADQTAATTAPAEARYFQVADAYVDKGQLLAFLADRAADIEAIYHLGACSDTTVTDRDWIMANNLEYTRQLWQWCTESQKPFVYASSAATYGDGIHGYDDEVNPRRYKPMNLYGESKHLFDLWALKQKDTPPRWGGVKYFNVYGPREEHKARMASMAYHWFKQIRKSGEARLFESYRPNIAHGDQQRDFIFVVDAVDATMHLMKTTPSTAAPNGLYNVGTGAARTFADLADAMFAAMDRPANLRFIPMPQDLRDQYQYFTQATVAKLRRSGFDRPFLTVEEGTAQYVGQYLAQQGAAV